MTEVLTETKTQFTVVTGERFVKNTLRMVGADVWRPTYARPASEHWLARLNESQEAQRRRALAKKLSDFRWHNLSMEKLEQIISLLEEQS